MKAFKLVLIFSVIFLITGCTKTENNNIIERSSRENDDVTVAVVLSSESAIIPDQQITETVSQPANSHETEQKEEPDQVAEQIITIDKCQVNAEGEYTDIWTQELLNLINTERINNNLTELQYDVTLEACADVRVKEASQIWSHTRPDGQKWNTVSIGYYRGENLARGYNSAQEIFDAWMASQSHKDNILHKEYKTIGLSIFKTERGYVVCAGFGI